MVWGFWAGLVFWVGLVVDVLDPCFMLGSTSYWRAVLGGYF